MLEFPRVINISFLQASIQSALPKTDSFGTGHSVGLREMSVLRRVN